MIIKEIVKILEKGGIGVLPTDTLYGLVGSALSKKAIARIYIVRRRDPKKPMIILINSFSDLKKIGVKIDKRILDFLKKIWLEPAQPSPKVSTGAVSVILPCPSKKFLYLHRGTKTLAVRIPKALWLRKLLKETGPLVAPSANLEGRPPALTIAQAEKYFGHKVDFYFNKGFLRKKPSILIEIKR